MHYQGNSNSLPKPVLTNAVWRGSELFSRADWRYEVSKDDRQVFQKTLNRVKGLDGQLEDLKRDDIPLGSFGVHLQHVQENLENGSGAHLIRGLPVHKWDIEQTRRIFWGIATHLGTPVSQSHKGEKIFSVRDEGFQIGQPQARGPNTRKRLSFHTDRCDVIGFLCLRQARSGGANQIVSSVAVYNEMLKRRPDLVKALKQPFYYQRHNVDTGNERPWCRQPIFSFCKGHFACSYLRVLIDRAYANPELPDMSAVEREALDFLEELASDPELHVTFRQEPGDLLLLNNWVTLHRRDEFEDYDEPSQRRHLLRIWLAVPNSRPLVAEFADNYGATAAGAVRGGMRPQVKR